MTRFITFMVALALAAPVAAQDTTAQTPATPSASERNAAPGSDAAAGADTAADTDATSDTSGNADTAAGAGTDAPAGTDAQATGQTSEQSGAPVPGLSMGSDASADPTVGQAYIREESGDWSLQCVKVSEGDEPCQLYQLLTDEDGNPVAEFTLFRLPEGRQASAGATVIVPLETLLTKDLLIGVDGAKGKRYRFSYCTQIGCFAQIGLTDADLAAFRRGRMATVTISPAFAPEDVLVQLNLSLAGFTAGFEKTTVAQLPGEQPQQ